MVKLLYLHSQYEYEPIKRDSSALADPEIIHASMTEEQGLRSFFDTHPSKNLLSPEETKWFLQEIETTANAQETREKLSFYLGAAKKRSEILQRTPQSHQTKVEAKINDLLNSPSAGSSREYTKGKSLEEMESALDEFLRIQAYVNENISKIKQIPTSLRDRVWARFMKRFDQETDGDIVNLDLIGNFRQSVETTFLHLGKVFEIQDQIHRNINHKCFRVVGDQNIPMKNDIGKTFENRLNQWLAQEISLRDWVEQFEDLLKTQMPQKIRDFDQHYNQVFNPAFWKKIPRINPVDFPNFNGAFNFRTEDDFLSGMSMGVLKALPSKLRKAVISDKNELFQNDFSTKERAQWNSRFRQIPSNNVAAMLQFLIDLKKQKERNAINELYKVDAIEAYQLEKKTRAQASDQNHDNPQSQEEQFDSSEEEEVVDISTEKQTKILFYDKCIEHARKVMEACQELGIPTNDLKYWGQESIPQRVSRLKEMGLYDTYKKYNASDPNIPREKQAGGFRFRWVDGKRVDELKLHSANSGIRYLNRCKESGYPVCALAGAFSINWKGPDSETYTPEKYISLIESERSKV